MTSSLPIPLTSPLTTAQRTTLINLVRRAAKAEILPRFRNLSRDQIRTKSSALDLVTDADTEAEAMLTRGILRMFPHALVVGEEAASADDSLQGKIAEAELCFLLDPVDGTSNFARGLPLFGVIIAVTRFGKPVLGLIYDPVMDDWMFADEATQTYYENAAGTAELSETTGFVHSSYMPEDLRQLAVVESLRLAQVFSLRCSAHEYRTLAQGGAHFCLSGMLTPWDHAAGVLLCQMAGGHVAMVDGSDYNAAMTDGYLLTAPDKDSWNRLRAHFAFLLDEKDLN